MRYLREMEWGRDSFAARWWPGSEPGLGEILAGTGIRTEDVFSRFSAGEPLGELAEEYGLTLAKIEAAVRLEVRLLEPERIAA